MSRAYGWKPDLPDYRDIPHVSLARPHDLPPSVTLLGFPPCYDQGNLGSCTANAIASAIDYERHKMGKKLLLPSRLFIYYNERSIEHTVRQDAGASIRDGVKSVHKLGACSELFWPYQEIRFARKPEVHVYTLASHNKVPAYRSVAVQLTAIKLALFENFPIIAGFTVYENFESNEVASSGIVGMPSGKMVGGHCILIVGYDDTREMFYCRNSWGEHWGIGGYFWMPYAYLTDRNLADDFWTLQP